MKLSRREFLALSAKATAGTMIFAACGLPERELIVQSPIDMPEDLVRGEDAWYATTWPDMPGGDGLIVRVMQGRAKKIAGNPDHPVNLGKQSSRHDAAIQLTYHPDRISEPMLRQSKGGLYDPIPWHRAEQLVQRAVEAGKDNMSVVTNPLGGHLEWVAINFAALNGGRHIKFDPTEQGVMQDAIKFVYEQEDPPYYDIANANTILSIGADWLSTWQSSVGYSVRYGEFRSKHDRGYLIHAEPRMSMTAANADLWLPVIPGYEGHLAMSIAQVIVDERLTGSGEIARFFNQIPTPSLVGFRPEDVEERVGVSAYKIRKAARHFAEHRPSLAFAGGSAGAHTNGQFNIAATHALNTLVSAVGSDGGVKYNPLAVLEGVTGRSSGDSFSDWEVELAQWRGGNVQSVIIRGADIVHGMPNSVGVVGAMDGVPTVIGFGSVMNDTLANCDLILPEKTFLETWGTTIPDPAPGYEVVTIQQPVIGQTELFSGGGLIADARGFGDELLRIAGGDLGADDMEELVNISIDQLYELDRGSVSAPNKRLFKQGVLQRGGWWDTESAAETPSDHAPPNVFDLESAVLYSDTSGLGEGDDFHLVPFLSNSLYEGRLSATPFAMQNPDPMSSAAWATWAEMNDKEAEHLGIREGDVLFIKSEYGEIEALAYPTPGGRPGVIGVPIGLGHENGGRYDEGLGANVLKILAPHVEPASGSLAWAATRVRVARSGRKRELAKFEGEVTAFPIEPGVPVLVVAPGESAHDAEIANHHTYQQEFLLPDNDEEDEEESGGDH